MPGGFVPYHHSTGKTYKKKSTTSSVSSGVTSFSSGVSKGASKVYGGSPSSYGYVPPTSTSSSSSSSAAAAKAVAQAQAAVKAAKAVVSEYGKDKKNPKSVSGKYAKATEKAKKKREKSKVRVEKKTREVKAKYDATPKKLTKTPKFGPGNAYTVWEGSNKIASKARELAGGSKPLKPTGSRQKPSTRPTGPKPRKVANRLERAVSQAKPTYSGLDSEQQKVLNTVLSQGVKAGADRKTLLSAVETGLVESGLRNLNHGDADSQGWRQERSMYYPNPTNVKASAKRYFQEAAEARAPGQTAGNLAQAAQQSAFPERYDAVAGEAKPLLKEFTSTRKEGVPKPLKRTARQTLGKQPTKAILQGGKVVKDKSGNQKKLQVSELFYDPGISLDDNGAGLTKISPIGGHSDHVHVSSTDPRSMLQSIAIAHRLGLNVSENPAVDSVDPVHASGSFHYNSEKIPSNLKGLEKRADASGKQVGQAIDVSGDPAAMAQFNQIIAGRATGDAAPVSVPIAGTNLAVKVPTPATTGSSVSGVGGTATSSTGAPLSPAEAAAQAAEMRRRRSPSVSKRLAAIDRWMTSPVTAPTPEISQELIDRILGK